MSYAFSKSLAYNTKTNVYAVDKKIIFSLLWIRMSFFLFIFTFISGFFGIGFFYYTQTKAPYWDYNEFRVDSVEGDLVVAKGEFSKTIQRLKWANSAVRPFHVLDVLSTVQIPLVKRLENGVLSEESAEDIPIGDSKDDILARSLIMLDLEPALVLRDFEMRQVFPSRIPVARGPYSKEVKQPPLIEYRFSYNWSFDTKSGVRMVPDYTESITRNIRPDFTDSIFVPWVMEFDYNQNLVSESSLKDGYRFGLKADGVIYPEVLFAVKAGNSLSDMEESYSEFYKKIQGEVKDLEKQKY